MNVFLLTTGPFPKGVASIARLKCYAKAIQQAGIYCELDVFERTATEYRDGYSKHVRTNEEGINYWYAGGRLCGSKNRFIRKVQSWLDKHRMATYIKRRVKPGDCVLVYFSDVYFSKKIIEIVHEQGGKVIKELNELPGKGGSSKKSKIIKQRTEKELFPLFDGVICISDALLMYVKQYVTPSCITIKIPILVDFSEYDLEDRHQQSETQFIFHAGSLYEQKDGILGMLEAFGLATKSLNMPLQYRLTGYKDQSPHKEEIDKILTKYQLQDKVLFMGYLNKEELRENLAKASCVIINKYNTLQNKYCFSTKLGEYLAAAKPVIITNIGEACNWLKDGETAYIVEQGNTEELAKAIIRLYSDEAKSEEIAKRGKYLCRVSFDYLQYSDIFSMFLKKIVYGE